MLLAFLATAAAVETPLTVVVPCSQCGYEPVTITARVRVELHPDNRFVCLQRVNTSTGDELTSCWQLEGATSPRTHFRVWRDLPAGAYRLRAWVIRPSETMLSATQIFHILSR